MPDSTGVNKEQQYGEFLARERQGNRFNYRVACKSLDMAPEDGGMNISNGISGKVLLGLGGMVIAGLTAVAIAYILGGQPASPSAPPADQQVELTVEIRDQHGELMYIPTATPTP